MYESKAQGTRPGLETELWESLALRCNGNHDRGCHYSGSMWNEKKSGWRTEPCEMAAVAEQMEEDKPTKGPEKEPSKVQGDPENVVSWKLQEGRDD